MANDLRQEMEQMKQFMLRQEDEIVRLKKLSRLEEEDNLSLEGESILGQRFYDIETELSEQKRSTAKITKLCMAAINSLERIEEKPGNYIINAVDMVKYSCVVFQSSLKWMKV